jgi:hypothetical protein
MAAQYLKQTVTHYYPHANRGKKTMDDIGILGKGTGINDTRRVACLLQLRGENTRALQRASSTGTELAEEEGQKWAGAMITLLLSTNEEVNESGKKLTEEGQGKVRKNARYRRRKKKSGGGYQRRRREISWNG